MSGFVDKSGSQNAQDLYRELAEIAEGQNPKDICSKKATYKICKLAMGVGRTGKMGGEAEVALIALATKIDEIEEKVKEEANGLREANELLGGSVASAEEKTRKTSQELEAAQSSIQRLEEENAEIGTLKGRVHSLEESVKNRDFVVRIAEDRVQVLEAANSELREAFQDRVQVFEAINSGLKEALEKQSAILRTQSESGVQVVYALAGAQVCSDHEIQKLHYQLQAQEGEIERLRGELASHQGSSSSVGPRALTVQQLALQFDQLQESSGPSKETLAKTIIALADKRKKLEAEVIAQQQVVSDLKREIQDKEQLTSNQAVVIGLLFEQLAKAERDLKVAQEGCKTVVSSHRELSKEFRALRGASKARIALLEGERRRSHGKKKKSDRSVVSVVKDSKGKEEKILPLANLPVSNPVIQFTLTASAAMAPQMPSIALQAGRTEQPAKSAEPLLYDFGTEKVEETVEPKSVGRWQSGLNFIGKHPVLTAVTVASVAVAIGVATFSFMYPSEEDTTSTGLGDENPVADFYAATRDTLYDAGNAVVNSLYEDLSGITEAWKEVNPQEELSALTNAWEEVDSQEDVLALRNILAEVGPGLSEDLSTVRAALDAAGIPEVVSTVSNSLGTALFNGMAVHVPG